MGTLPLALGFWANELGGLIWIGVAITWICAIYDLMAKRPDLDGRHRAAWLLLIILFPIVGAVMYFVSRPTLPDEQERMLAAQAALRQQGTSTRP